MKDFPSLSEFLHDAGISSNTPKEELEALKKAHGRAYQAWYHRHQRKQNTHRYTLRFSKTEWAELQRTAKRYTQADSSPIAKQTDIAPFIKRATLAYITKQYVPNDPRPMVELQKEFRMVGNMLSQAIDSIARLRRQIHHSR